jgi:uncharacterized protein (DUF2141 family)
MTRQSFCAALCCALPLMVNAATTDPADSAVRAEFSGLHNANGAVACLLFNSADGFPEAVDKAYRVVRAPISAQHAVCEFANIAPGTYAVMAMHDENGNGKMDKNLLGMPMEGYIASNNIRHAISPPRFQEAAFIVASGTVKTVQVEMRY